MSHTVRLDTLLIEEGFVKDKNAAFVIVTEGHVLVNGQKAVSPAQLVKKDAAIELRHAMRYVGRGAEKLESALRNFKVEVAGKICADIGAATGGFTQVLIMRGASRVYAIDTARGKLALKVREDPRVVVREGADIRKIERLPEPVNLVTIDVSLLPLRAILPSVRKLMLPGAEIIALLKPQYETRDPRILRHGVVKNALAREGLRDDFIRWARMHQWEILKQMESPLRGSKGNVEYLLLLRPAGGKENC